MSKKKISSKIKYGNGSGKVYDVMPVERINIHFPYYDKLLKGAMFNDLSVYITLDDVELIKLAKAFNKKKIEMDADGLIGFSIKEGNLELHFVVG